MTSRRMPRPAAFAAVLVSVVTSVLLVPAVALADEPASDAWGDTENLTTLYVVLVFVGGPVLLFAIIAVLGSLGTHRTYPRPVLGEEAAIEAGEQHGEALRRSTGLGDEPAEVPAGTAAAERPRV